MSDTTLVPRVERLENQYHELSVSHAEAMLMLETYMKSLNAMQAMLLEIKEWLKPDKDEWEKEASINQRFIYLETFIKRFKTITKWSFIGVLGLGWLIISAQQIELSTIINFFISKFQWP